MSLKIAIVGLGRVGSEFLEELVNHTDKGLSIVCAAEVFETPGRKLARDQGIELGTIDDIIEKGDEVDVIFDLTGNKTVRKALREALERVGNQHTVVAPETVSRMIWALMTDKTLPEVHSYTGY